MYVGIDVSKNKSNICVLDKDKKVVDEFVLKHNAEGFQQLEEKISLDMKIGMEVTSTYCKALFYYLKNKGYQVFYVDNVQMNNFAKLNFPSIKNDRIDSKLLAIYMSYGFKTIRPIQTDQIKDLSRLYYKTQKQLTRYKYMFLNQINIIFPELEEHCFLKKTYFIAKMLIKYPSPQKIAEVKTEELRSAILEGYNRGTRYTLEYCKELQELARISVGVKDYPTDCFVYTIQIMMFYQNMIDNIKKRFKELLLEIPYGKLLDEFGYNSVGVAMIVGEVGDIRRFSNHKQFVKYCGYDVSEKQSGKSKSVNCFITKKGNRFLRKIFYERVLVHICYDTEVGKFYKRLK
ncbi:IS110 family transposase [Candidatus Woesearchaeota archaeon]|nr:IS110 family transposase [Candidatus Woesearchaeota archaeon]